MQGLGFNVPALAAGIWVLSDRFADSTRAYQGAGRNAPLATLDVIERSVLGGLAPDLTIVLDLPPEKGLGRLAGRAAGGSAPALAIMPQTPVPDPFESRDIAFHERLRAAYLAIAHAEPDRCVVVNASRPSADIATTIAVLVETRLGLR